MDINGLMKKEVQKHLPIPGRRFLLNEMGRMPEPVKVVKAEKGAIVVEYDGVGLFRRIDAMEFDVITTSLEELDELS